VKLINYKCFGCVNKRMGLCCEDTKSLFVCSIKGYKSYLGKSLVYEEKTSKNAFSEQLNFGEFWSLGSYGARLLISNLFLII